ncbi:MAG: hypothetical protein AB1423_12220 [Pseudomonadota bacterium]
MSALYDPELDAELNQNGTEPLQHIDAGSLTGIGKGIETGLSNAGTSLSRVSSNIGAAQMRVSGAEMMAGGSLTGDYSTVQTGADLSAVSQPDESQLPQYKSFDPEQVGTVGTILGGLAQQIPSLAAMVVNPVAGAVMAAAQGQTEAHAEGAKLGLTGSALEDYSGVGAVSGAVGASIPGFAGFGRGAVLYGSRFVLGGLANTAASEADRWGRAAILDNAGFHDQAMQMRQADGASIATDFVLGGAFGLLGGRHREDASPEPVQPLTDKSSANTADPAGTQDVNQVTNADTPDDTKQSSPDSNMPSFSDYAGSLEEKSSQLMNRGDRKVWQSEIANSQRILGNLNQQRNDITASPLKGSGKELSQARQDRAAKLSAIDQQITSVQSRLQDATNTLAAHVPGGENFEAKASLSRLYDRLQSERTMVSSVHEDAATAHMLHDNYVTESAPGLATDPASESAHVNAMDSAGDSVNTGKAVDVTDHINDENTYLVHGDIDGPTLDRQELAGDAPQRMDSIASAADQQSLPAANTKEFQPGVISDTQTNPFDLIREQAEALRETHPELSDLISTHLESVESEHTAAHQNAETYDVAAACALKYGN